LSTVPPNTLAIDIHYFLVMILSIMIIFFAIGVHTVPSPPSAATINSDSSTDTSTGTPPQRRTNAKHSSHIGHKIDLNEHHVNFEDPTYEDLGIGE
jgi:hypothetical protein